MGNHNPRNNVPFDRSEKGGFFMLILRKEALGWYDETHHRGALVPTEDGSFDLESAWYELGIALFKIHAGTTTK